MLHTCPNCLHETTWKVAWGEAFLGRCTICGGCTWLGEANLDGLYEEAYFRAGEYVDYELGMAAHRTNFRRKIDLLRQHSGIEISKVRLLELGSATGAFLAEAKLAGVQDWLGIEVSGWARQRSCDAGFQAYAPEDPGLSRRIASLRPNMIVAWDTWEHLANPAQVISRLIASLGPGGVVSLSTVDSGSVVARWRKTRWRQFHPPTHLNYPSRESLRRFFAQLGMHLTYQRAFGYHRPIAEYARGMGVRRFPDWLARAKPVPIHLNLFDTQLCIARRAVNG